MLAHLEQMLINRHPGSGSALESSTTADPVRPKLKAGEATADWQAVFRSRGGTDARRAARAFALTTLRPLNTFVQLKKTRG